MAKHADIPVFQVMDGKPYYIESLRDWYEECCHCGLVHKVKYRVEDSSGAAIKGAKVRVTAWQMPRITAGRRQDNGRIHEVWIPDEKRRKR